MEHKRWYETWLASAVLAIAAGCSDATEGPAAGSNVSPGTREAPASAGAETPAGAQTGSNALFAGEPIKDAPERSWQWLDVAGAKCRSGSAAGFAVNMAPASRKVMIYLEGGGSCYDAQTCQGNPASVRSQTPGNGGIFDRANPANPVGEWSMVYVPYCSGDLHMGDADDATVAGVDGVHQFKGRPNLTLFLRRLVPTFADAQQVLLTGASAGGIGAIMNYAYVQAAFGSVPVTMIDDSGPLLSTQLVPACANQLRRAYWGLDKTILKECGSACDADGGYTLEFARQTLLKLTRASGIIESNHDQVIRAFTGIASNNGKNDCQGSLSDTPFDAGQFETALLDMREQLRAVSSTFSSFFPVSMQHVWTSGPGFYTQTAGPEGVKLVDWFRTVLDNQPAGHQGP